MNKKECEMRKSRLETTDEYMDMITKSWTWARLTEEEKDKFTNWLYAERFIETINGTIKQRWNILDNYYHMFLEGVGYQPIGWREHEDVPQF